MSSLGVATQEGPSFERASDVDVAAYVEQLVNSEHLWIMNRLSWLLVSQSFLVIAFVTLVTAPKEIALRQTYLFLKLAIPWLGIVCCTLVGGAVLAAARETRFLIETRGCLSTQINARYHIQIPIVGVAHRDRRWTYRVGALPHRFLPGVLALFWILALFYLR